MQNYNYANEIIKDNDELHLEKGNVKNTDPKEKIVNEQDQDITLNMEEAKNEADEAFKAFEEGVRNDNISTEEEKEDSEKETTKK